MSLSFTLFAGLSRSRIQVRLSIHSSHGLKFSKLSTAWHKVQDRTNTREVLAMCRNWLQDCVANHEICRERVGTIDKWLPTRLLDTGAPADPVSLRLVVGENLAGTGAKYLALSHCWGKSVILSLKTSNIEAFEEEIPFSSLPRTFQHATVAARSLGYRYLWIDSLCILQDSSEDWQYESSFMGDVYSQCDCVIAATGSKDGSGGLFRIREPKFIEPFILRAKWSFYEEDYTCVNADVWTRGVAEAPLNQRGWVVQERMLAPRTLHFGDHQIFWECRQLEACETMPQGLPSDLIVAGDREGNAFKRWMKPIKRTANDAQQVSDGPLDSWDYIVEVYMRSKLTKGEDKLIALSGMAKKMQLVLKDEYLAGLWRSSLVNGMLWWAEDADTPSKRYPLYRGPSWSWASIDGNISRTVSSDLYGDFVKILEVTIQPLGKDLTGQVQSGHIMLECIVKAINKPSAHHWSSMFTSGQYHPDDRRESESLDEFYALPLRNHRIRVQDDEDLWGLIIAKEDSSPNTFRRVGFFRVEDGEDIKFVGSKSPPEKVSNFGLSINDKRQLIRLV